MLGHVRLGNDEAAQNKLLAFPPVQGLGKYPEHKQGIVTNVFMYKVFPVEAPGIEAHIAFEKHDGNVFEPPSGSISDFIKMIGSDELTEDLVLKR